jgi:hypothetical protein
LENKSSKVTTNATRRIKLTILPIPKYLKRRKTVKAVAMVNPLLLLAKMVEKVKRRARKRRTNKTGRIPNVSGSTK